MAAETTAVDTERGQDVAARSRRALLNNKYLMLGPLRTPLARPFEYNRLDLTTARVHAGRTSSRRPRVSETPFKMSRIFNHAAASLRQTRRIVTLRRT